MRRLTPSPTELTNNQTFLVGLRPRELRDRILESLRLNDLPLVMNTSVGEALDFQLLQRLLNENPRIRSELIKLSLASYEAGANAVEEAETLLNFIFSRLHLEELLAIQDLLKTNIIDDSVVGHVINLIRLTGINEPLKFITILENSLNGTLNLRRFMGHLDTTTQLNLVRLDDLEAKKVPQDILDTINDKELQGLAALDEKASAIELRQLERIDQIVLNANLQRVLMNTGITFGVSGLIWASYRFGLWDSVVSNLNTNRPRPINNEEHTMLENFKLFMAGTTGFLLKKGLLRR